jgi:hypothetical protein
VDFACLAHRLGTESQEKLLKAAKWVPWTAVDPAPVSELYYEWRCSDKHRLIKKHKKKPLKAVVSNDVRGRLGHMMSHVPKSHPVIVKPVFVLHCLEKMKKQCV